MPAEQSPPGLRLKLFGQFEAQVEDRPIPRLRSRKGAWLLALLALRRCQAVARPWLAGTLWPESSETQALASLRMALADLRHALGPQAARLCAPTPRTLSLEVSEADVDVLAFDRAIARRDPAFLQTAVELYRGPLLEGCLEEWVLPEREARRQSYLAALERLAKWAQERGEQTEVICRLRWLVAADPLRESAHRSLIEALAATGDFAAATQIYRDLRLLLHRELNAAPNPETVSLYERLRVEGQARAAKVALAPPSPRQSPPAGRLPSPLTRFIGREDELRRLQQLLSPERVGAGNRNRHRNPEATDCDNEDDFDVSMLNPQHPAPRARLVTLTGAGGVGKTRLAIRAAEELLDQFPDGVWFVDLAPLAEGDLVPQAVAATLQAREELGKPFLEVVAQLLESRTSLLMLDNCEHLSDSCARAARVLLERCPNLRILATSRQSLGLPGEAILRVPSLSIPPEVEGRVPAPGAASGWVPAGDAGDGGSVAHGAAGAERSDCSGSRSLHLLSVSRYESVQLFVERAQQARAGFALTDRNALAVAQVCRRLDGIPLAIELAATCVKALPVEQVAARLENGFRLVAGASNGALPRQKTLRATLEWSYQLLDEAQRILLPRLSIFAGGWTLEAAEAVCGDDGLGPRSGHPTTGDGRRMTAEAESPPSVVRGPSSVVARPDVIELLTGLVDKSLVVYEESESEARYRLLETVREFAGESLPEAEREALRERHFECYLGLAREAKARMGGPEDGPWLDRLGTEYENLRAALAWAAQPSAAHSASDTRVLQLALLLGHYWERRGPASEGREWLARALERAGEGISSLRLAGLNAAGDMATIQADYPAAQRVFEQALRAAEALSDTEQVRRACLGLGEVARRRGDTAAARVFAERALAIAREPHALRLLGYVARREGNYEQARALQEEALERWRRKGNLSGVATALGALARIAAAQGDRAAARRYFWESLDAAREIGDRLGLASALAGLGFEYTHAGDLTTARSMLAEALPIFRDLETSGALICLEGMAALDLAVGQRSEGVASAFRSARHAACLQAAAEALSDSLGLGAEETVRAEREARAAVLRAILGVDEFAAARAEGRALTLEQAIALALQEDFAPEAIDPDQGSKAA